jgi:two-component system cell cycle response regulator DivK
MRSLLASGSMRRRSGSAATTQSPSLFSEYEYLVIAFAYLIRDARALDRILVIVRSPWLARNHILGMTAVYVAETCAEVRETMAHILIIEDDYDIRHVTEFILAEAGHSVVSARDGLSGVEMATQIQPDLVLMDLSLPRLDGWKATHQLKTQTATLHIPVIAFTAHVSKAATTQAMLAGCETVISKPFEVDALLHIITLVLTHQALPGRYSSREMGGKL